MRYIILLLLLSNCDSIHLNQKPKNKNLETFILFGAINRNSTSNYNWNLPVGFPLPNVPAENPITESKVELGRFLFYDTKLSQNQTQSCSSCHIQSLAFTDGKTLAIGSTGMIHPKNAQNLANVAYNSRLTWANNKMLTLEQQMRVPMFGETPIELGLKNDDYLLRIKADSRYKDLFSKAFGGGSENITEQNIRFAISHFQRSLISGKSKVDMYTNYKQKSALNSSEIRGLEIFSGEVAECFHCHGGFNFADSVSHQSISVATVVYTNNGIKSQVEYNALPIEKRGLYEVTGNILDDGKFKAPSLRNIGLTFPYMHDGSFNCSIQNQNNVDACSTEALGKVVDHYMSGGKVHPTKDSSFIRPFVLSPQEKTDLVNFLKALTDDEFIKNPKHSNPFL